MTQTNVNWLAPRKPWLAVVFSLLATGLGQAYCGRLRRGLILLGISVACAPLALALQRSPLRTAWAGAVVALLVVAVAVDLYAAIDAYLGARKFRSAYVLRPYNRWYVYAALVAANAVLPISIGAAVSEGPPAFRMASDAMSPTLRSGDRVLMDYWAQLVAAPARGDVVLFTPPQPPPANRISRVAAVTGDAVEVRAGQLYVNDTPLERTPVDAAGPAAAGAPPGCRAFWEKNDRARYRIALGDDAAKHVNLLRTIVPDGHVFVISDNRDDAEDSRHFGPLPVGAIRGKVTFLWWPAEGWSRLGPVK